MLTRRVQLGCSLSKQLKKLLLCNFLGGEGGTKSTVNNHVSNLMKASAIALNVNVTQIYIHDLVVIVP